MFGHSKRELMEQTAAAVEKAKRCIEENEDLKNQRAELIKEKWRAQAEIEKRSKQAPFKELELRTPEEVKMRLGELVDSSPILAAFVTVIKGQGEIETGAAICPGLSDSDRQYNAGRAAAVADMLHAISQCREEGQRMLSEKGQVED